MSTADAPTVSVIMPTYNRAHLVGQSIQSVLDQTYRDFELIVVDDGSTDDTEQTVGRFSDPRIQYIYQDHRGIGAARNTGLRKAQGRYIAFLDSDDVWLPNLLEVGVPILEEHPAIGVVYAKAQAMDKYGKPMSQIRGAPQKYPGDALKSALYGDFLCIIATLVRRECWDRVGPFDETLMAREDWDMWIRIAKHYRLAHVDKVLARFRMHDDQRTGANSQYFAEATESGLRVLGKAFSDTDLPEDAFEIKALAYRNAYLEIALSWLNVGAWQRSARCFWTAVQVSPDPLATFLRIGWLILLHKVLIRTHWGSRAIDRLIRLRRKAGPITAQ